MAEISHWSRNRFVEEKAIFNKSPIYRRFNYCTEEKKNCPFSIGRLFNAKVLVAPHWYQTEGQGLDG